MNLSRVVLTGFQSYDDADVQLGPGLTLVTGDNGAGKSTMLEAVCWALFGRTLRGSDPWREGTPCKVTVHFTQGGKQCQVTRKRGASKVLVDFVVAGESLNAQTSTETTGRIASLVGRWEKFAAGRVFTREQVARFGAATDAERKELLEGALGLWQFDVALSAAKEEIRATDLARATVTAELNLLNDRRMRAVTTCASIVNEGGRDPGVIETALTQQQVFVAAQTASVERHSKQCRDLREMAARAQREFSAAEALARSASTRLVRAQVDTNRIEAACEVCRRPFDPASLAQAQESARAKVATLQAEYDPLVARLKELEPELVELREDVSAEELRLAEETPAERRARDGAAALAVELEAARSRTQRLAVASLEAREAAAAVKVAEGVLAQATGRLAVLQEAAKVLGIKGARVVLFNAALHQIEVEANRVLAALGGHLKVGLSTEVVVRTKKEDGSLAQRVILTVEGAGGGDYRGSSAGERARLDVALLLGLGAVSDGGAEGLVFFDEVFDAMDEAGVDDAARFLGTLAERRQVLVVSHHPSVVALLPRAKHLKASRASGGPSQIG